jgi:hypothetical protein
MGLRKRYRMLDVEKLLNLLGTEDVMSFRDNLSAALALAIEKGQLEREPRWTESVAVGSEGFVRGVQDLVDRRRREIRESAGAWTLREVAVTI